jgi:beta-lactamase regulating signal transducer with metallopeptidase domain
VVNAQINEIAGLWWQWMAPMLWQAALLVLIITVVDWMISKWVWPQVRYAVWLIILLKLVIPPALHSPLSLVSWAKPRVERSLLKADGDSQMPVKNVFGQAPGKAAARNAQSSGAAVDASRQSDERARNGSGRAADQAISSKAWALMIWVAGMLVFSALLFAKMARLRRWHRLQKEREIPKWFHELLLRTAGRLGLKQIPAIVFAKDAVTPAVYGMFRPVLLIPTGYLDKLSRREAEHVLLHELCHLKRGDLWVHGLYLILHVVYWFNPFLIWTRRQMKHVREICCDLSVAQVLREKTKGYRQTLLDSARSLLTETVEPGLGLLGVFEEPFRLVSRLKWLEKESWKHRNWILTASLFAGIGMAAVMIPMSVAEPPLLQEDPFAYRLAPGAEPLRIAGPDDTIESTSQNTKIPIPDFRVELKRTKPMTAVILPKIGPPTLMLESAMAELEYLIQQQRIEPSGDRFFRFWSDQEKVSQNQLVWEVGFPVDAGVSVKPPLELLRVSAMQVASATIRDVLETEPVWVAFVEKMKNMGLVPAFPPAVEVYRTENGQKPFWHTTELQMQALRPGADYPGMKIKFRETAPGTALVLPVQGSYAQFENRLNQVNEYVRKEKIKTTGRWMCLNFSDPSSVGPAELLWQVGCGIKPRADLKVEPPFELQHYGKDTVASAFFEGPPETYFPYTSFIMQNLMNGYMMAGPLGFAWEEDPREKNPKVESTEVFMRVVKLEGFAKTMEAFGKSMGRITVKSQTEPLPPGSLDKNGKKLPAPANEAEEPGNKGWKEKVSDFFKGSSESTAVRHPWILRRTDPYWAILLPAAGSMDQQSVVFEKLRNYMNANGIPAEGLPFTRQYYSGEIVKGFELRWEAGYRINDSAAVKPPFLVVKVPGRQILAVHYTPSLNQKTLNVQMASWLYHNGYRSPMPQVVIWSNGIPDALSDLKDADVEIPIEKMDKPYPEVRLFTRSDMARRELLMHMSGSWKQENEAVLKLKSYVKETKIETLGDVFVQYHNTSELTPEKDLTWEVGVPVKEDVRTTGPFRTEWRRGRLLACTNYEGNHPDIPLEFWWSYALNFTMSGYLAADYPRKVLLSGTSADKGSVELQWPVKQ